MTFANLAKGSSIFIDANTLVYHFIAHAQFGLSCTQLLERIENQELYGYCSAHVLGEVVHRLMTIEACSRFGWPTQGIAARLRSHPAELQQLSKHRQALDEIQLMGIQILPVTGSSVSHGADLSIQHGLLINDAICVAQMLAQKLQQIASNDTDFDRVPGIVRFSPI